MYVWFFVSLFGFAAVILPYFVSLEHLKLEEKYGKEKGKSIGEIYGIVSGWGFFLFWFGIWFSPQSRFTIPIFQDLLILLSVINLTIPLLHLLIFIPFFVVGAWLGIKGVAETTLKVAETHRPDKENWRLLDCQAPAISWRTISAYRDLFPFVSVVFFTRNSSDCCAYLFHFKKRRR